MCPACPALHTVGGGTGSAAAARKLRFPGKKMRRVEKIEKYCITHY